MASPATPVHAIVLALGGALLAIGLFVGLGPTTGGSGGEGLDCGSPWAPSVASTRSVVCQDNLGPQRAFAGVLVGLGALGMVCGAILTVRRRS